MSKDMTNWIEEDNIPHDNGKIQWFAIGFEEEETYYVGEYDMTDWDKTFDEVVFPKAQKHTDRCFKSNDWRIIRKDQLIDLMFNVAHALHCAGNGKEDWDLDDYFDDEKENGND